MGVIRGQKLGAYIFVKTFSLNALHQMDYDMVMLAVNNSIFVSSTSTGRPPWYSVQAVLNTGTISIVLAKDTGSMLSTTIGITIWKPVEGEKRKLKFSTRSSVRLFASD